MFIPADQLWLESLEDKLPLHALEFYWDKFEPGLVCYDTVRGKDVELDLDSVDLVVGKRKRCVGQFTDQGYKPCPSKASVTKFAQCDECAGEVFITDQECIFNPKCEGEKCERNELCKRQHVLYLAFYNTMVKVGMSSTRRVGRRLVEQGADAFALIGTFPNRYKAREAEKVVSADLRLPQWIRQQTILSNFSRPVDTLRIEARYEEMRTALAERAGFSVEPLVTLAGYPIELPLPSPPQLKDTWGTHRGRFLGLKGKWLIYESHGLKALSMPDLVGRFLARGSP